MGLYHNDSLKGNRQDRPYTGDEAADKIARFALTWLAPLIQIVIYSATNHNKALTARICGCDRRTIERLINSLPAKSKENPIWLQLNSLITAESAKPLPTDLDKIKSVVDRLKPFLPRHGGNPRQLGVSIEAIDNTLEVLRQLTILYHSSS